MNTQKLAPKFSKLALVDAADIVNLIRAHCRLEGGFAIWDEGWSDEKVVEHAGQKSARPIPLRAVESLLLQVIGRLPPAPNPGAKRGQFGQRVVALEAELVEVKRRITELEDYITRQAVRESRAGPPKLPFGTTMPTNPRAG
jgi:hypothetical protein